MTNHERRTVSNLFSAAFDWDHYDGEGDWTAVAALQKIGTWEVFQHAAELAGSGDPRVRARAVDIIGQLGVPQRTFPSECRTIIRNTFGPDADPRALEAALIAIAHFADGRDTDLIAGQAGHPVSAVRYAVAFALGGRVEPSAIKALTRLANDGESLVRDWATFGLGVIGSVDTLAVRDVLCERISDVDKGVRYEAINGLAKFGDLRAANPLIDALTAEPENAELHMPALTLLSLNSCTDDYTTDDLILRLRRLQQDSSRLT